ncbi:MAG: YbaK/EbsC family protein, partial [Thermotogaceae bacterium]|nr:YbaK/EbsC family protein [Thermotogaceae bacterium]
MISERVLRVLERYDLKYREFPDGSTPTAVTAADMLGVAVGQIAKS